MMRARAALAASILLIPSSAAAQGSRYAIAAVSIVQTYDDNLFAASRSGDQARDATVRLGPAFEAGYVSQPLTLLARYSFDAERYVDRPALSRGLARQDAALELRQRPTPRLAFNLKTAYLESHTPYEFNIDSGLAAGRARAERFAAMSTAAYDWTPLTRADLEVAFTRDALEGGLATVVGDARLGIERHDNARDARRVDYRLQQFSFGDGGSETWHIVTAGWSHDVTRRTSVELTLGPRVSGRLVRPEVEAVVRRRLQKGELSTSYARTQATAIGDAGTIDVQRIAASLMYQPARRVTVSAGPAFAASDRAGTHVSVYAIDLDASGRLRNGVTLVLSGRVGLQRGTLAGRREEIPYRRISLGLTAAVPRAPRVRRAGETR